MILFNATMFAICQFLVQLPDLFFQERDVQLDSLIHKTSRGTLSAISGVSISFRQRKTGGPPLSPPVSALRSPLVE
jgi:hypothetical protein